MIKKKHLTKEEKEMLKKWEAEQDSRLQVSHKNFRVGKVKKSKRT